VSHNIEKIDSEDGLDALTQQIMRMCSYSLEWVFDDSLKKSVQQQVLREEPVPIVFAFTRRALSRCLKRSAKTSYAVCPLHTTACGRPLLGYLHL
ncbi:MAG: hypothetical protein SGPRY_013808, partial [Prymnesium sp.]